MTGDAGLRIGVLGPLLGTRDGAAIAMPRGRPAVLLAALAMSPGHPVGGARLAELIWDDDERPDRARARLQTVVARLRGLLPGVVVTAGDGYLLDVDRAQVDLWRFRHLVQTAAQASGPAALSMLDEAAGLWRGEPLGELRSTALDRDVIPGLTEEYLSAVQQRAGLGLTAGRHEQVTAELRGLTGRYPLREPLWELLMRALAQSGRPAEAIAEYHRARQVLAAELGVDPSSALQSLYQELLQADQPSAAAGPPAGSAAGPLRRLPADTRVFTGRRPELAQLLELAGATDGAGGTVLITAIDGMAGIGKTALAVRTAHQLAGRFPDGQLFIDLHGYTQGYPPRTADQALEVFLRTLGVPTPQIPGDTEERAALYRERLAGTRTLIVLDNAADGAQVRPLIPGSAGCMVLVTSRRKLQALDDAHTLALDVMPEPDAIALLCTAAGPCRVAAGDPAVADIVGLCGRLPLAVRIAAALLRNRPTWSPHHLASRLRAIHTRLAALAGADEARDPAALFDLSSQDLRDDLRRLYRYLGLTPAPEIDAFAAAALLDSDPATAERLLQDLVDHNLLLEPAAGRYRMHDLIRAHARTLAGQDPVREQQGALSRLLDYYQHAAGRADARIARAPRPGPVPAHLPELPGADAARAWLRAERASLAACLQHAIQHGQDDRVVAFTAGVASLLRADGPWPKATAAQAAGAAAAARLGDRAAQARALTELGALRRLTGNYADADRDLQTALELYRGAGDQTAQGRVLTEIGTVHRMSGDYQGARPRLEAALELGRQVNDQIGQAHALTQLGIVCSVSGQFQEAEPQFHRALELYQHAGELAGQPRALTELAELQRLTGDYESAARNAEAALAISRQLGDQLAQANALLRLGRTLCMTGDYESAGRHQETALAIFRELGARLGQANALTLLAEVKSLAGDYDGAARSLEQSIRTYRDLGNRGNQANAQNQYAAVIRAAGDLTRAVYLFHEALDLAREAQQPDEEAVALEGLGETLLRQREVAGGVTRLRQALDIYQRLGMAAAGTVTARLAEFGALK